MTAALLGAAAGAALGAVAFGFTYSQTPTQASSGARGRPAHTRPCGDQCRKSGTIAKRYSAVFQIL